MLKLVIQIGIVYASGVSTAVVAVSRVIKSPNSTHCWGTLIYFARRSLGWTVWRSGNGFDYGYRVCFGGSVHRAFRYSCGAGSAKFANIPEATPAPTRSRVTIGRCAWRRRFGFARDVVGGDAQLFERRLDGS